MCLGCAVSSIACHVGQAASRAPVTELPGTLPSAHPGSHPGAGCGGQDREGREGRKRSYRKRRRRRSAGFWDREHRSNTSTRRMPPTSQHSHSGPCLAATGLQSPVPLPRPDVLGAGRAGRHTLLSPARGLGRLIPRLALSTSPPPPAVLTVQLGSEGTPLHRPHVMDGWWIIKMSARLPPRALAQGRDDE